MKDHAFVLQASRKPRYALCTRRGSFRGRLQESALLQKCTFCKNARFASFWLTVHMDPEDTMHFFENRSQGGKKRQRSPPILVWIANSFTSLLVHTNNSGFLVPALFVFLLCSVSPFTVCLQHVSICACSISSSTFEMMRGRRRKKILFSYVWTNPDWIIFFS